MSARARVVVRSRKWDLTLHRRSTGVELGSDQHGCWLWMPSQDVELAGGRSYRSYPTLRLLPVGLCWSAWFCPAVRDRHPKQVYVDISTPVTRVGDTIGFVDLDLDVEQLDDGPVRILDEDEFAINAERYGYPLATRVSAEETCRQVFDAVVRREGPFDGSHLAWLSLGQAVTGTDSPI